MEVVVPSSSEESRPPYELPPKRVGSIEIIDVDLSGFRKSLSPICQCKDPDSCLSLQVILQKLKKPLQEETAWGLLHQLLNLLRNYRRTTSNFSDFEAPEEINNICLHANGQVHLQWPDEQLADKYCNRKAKRSDQSVLQSIGKVIYKSMNYTLARREQNILSKSIEDFLKFLIIGVDDNRRSLGKYASASLRFFDYALDKCKSRIKLKLPTFHYMGLCSTLYEDGLEALSKSSRLDCTDSSSDENFSVSDDTGSPSQTESDESIRGGNDESDESINGGIVCQPESEITIDSNVVQLSNLPEFLN